MNKHLVSYYNFSSVIHAWENYDHPVDPVTEIWQL